MGRCWSALSSATSETITGGRVLSQQLCGYLEHNGRFCICSSCLRTCCYRIGFAFILLLCWPVGCCWVIVKCIRFCRGGVPRSRRPSGVPVSADEYQPVPGDDHSSVDTASLSTQSDAEPRLNNIKNYLFYTNQLASEPNGDLVDNIHESWWTDYSNLEHHHGFIQWLFPLPEPGVNPLAQELQPHEIDLIKNDQQAQARLLKSYKMMLGFYGLELVNDVTGEVRRAQNWKFRFDNLNRNSHNNLRISRILRSLGLLGFEHLKYPLLECMLREIVVEKNLQRCRDSCFNFWIRTLSDEDYDSIQEYIQNLNEEVRTREQKKHDEEKSRLRKEQEEAQQKKNIVLSQSEIDDSNRVSSKDVKQSESVKQTERDKDVKQSDGTVETEHDATKASDIVSTKKVQLEYDIPTKAVEDSDSRADQVELEHGLVASKALDVTHMKTDNSEYDDRREEHSELSESTRQQETDNRDAVIAATLADSELQADTKENIDSTETQQQTTADSTTNKLSEPPMETIEDKDCTEITSETTADTTQNEQSNCNSPKLAEISPRSDSPDASKELTESISSNI